MSNIRRALIKRGIIPKADAKKKEEERKAKKAAEKAAKPGAATGGAFGKGPRKSPRLAATEEPSLGEDQWHRERR